MERLAGGGENEALVIGSFGVARRSDCGGKWLGMVTRGRRKEAGESRQCAFFCALAIRHSNIADNSLIIAIQRTNRPPPFIPLVELV